MFCASSRLFPHFAYIGKKGGENLDFELLSRLFESCLYADYREVENGGSFAVVRDGELLYLFFEKSSGGEDWKNNLSFRAVDCDCEGEFFCHRGFLQVWRSVLPHIERQIQSPSVRRIVSVGYSHGAALALLCHSYIYSSRPDIRQDCDGFGFGCPRVIRGRVSDAAERWSKFYRVSVAGDVVTELPPKIFGYRHVGKEIKVGKSGIYSGIDAHRPEIYALELDAAANDLTKRTK